MERLEQNYYFEKEILQKTQIVLQSLVSKQINSDDIIKVKHDFKKGDYVTFINSSLNNESVMAVGKVLYLFSDRTAVELIGQQNPLIDDSPLYRHNGGATLTLFLKDVSLWDGSINEILEPEIQEDFEASRKDSYLNSIPTITDTIHERNSNSESNDQGIGAPTKLQSFRFRGTKYGDESSQVGDWKPFSSSKEAVNDNVNMSIHHAKIEDQEIFEEEDDFDHELKHSSDRLHFISNDTSPLKRKISEDSPLHLQTKKKKKVEKSFSSDEFYALLQGSNYQDLTFVNTSQLLPLFLETLKLSKEFQISIFFLDGSSSFHNTITNFHEHFTIVFHLPKENRGYYLLLSALVDDIEERCFYQKLITCDHVSSYNISNNENEKKEINRLSNSILERIQEVLSDLFLHKSIIVYDAKSVLKYLLRIFPNLPIPNHLFDIKSAAWLLQSKSESQYSIPSLYNRYLPTFFDNTTDDSAKETLDQFLEYSKHCVELSKALIQELELAEFQYITEVEVPISWILAKMENIGIQSDNSQFQSSISAVRSYLNTLTKQAIEMVGIEFNLSSPKQVAEVIYGHLKIAVPASTKKLSKSEYYSTSDQVLSGISHLHPLPQMIIEYRSVMKLLSTMETFLDPNVIRDRKIFCSWNQTNSVTGRITCSSPSLQQLPRSDHVLGTIGEKVLINIRRVIVPRKNMLLISFDYSQLEARILAHFSGDKDLISFFCSGKDIHTLIASKCYNKPVSDVSKEERTSAKEICYGIIYGMSPQTISLKLKMPITEANKLYNSFLAKFPGISLYKKHVIKECTSTGSITTLFDRKRRINVKEFNTPQLQQYFKRIAFNGVIQGSAGDIVKMAMVNIFRKLHGLHEFLKVSLILQMHDELIFESPTDVAKQLIQIVQHEMENVVSLRVPLPVCVKIGDDYGSLLDYEEFIQKFGTSMLQ